MDTMRGNFGALAGSDGYDPAEDDETARQAPPPAIGQDERRMQVRAYNHWASLLEDRNFPGIEDLEPESLPDFGPYSVLLDFSSGIENPGISYLGDKLAGECGAGDAELHTLADVPSRSLLTRITDHYMQILANQAPIGFEAEFVNQRGATIAYRGILLPFSSDDDTIDFIYGVINWKELADAQASDELLLEIDQALEAKPTSLLDTPLTDWADGPGAAPANDLANDQDDDGNASAPSIGDFGTAGLPDLGGNDLPLPSFGLGEVEAEETYLHETEADEMGLYELNGVEESLDQDADEDADEDGADEAILDELDEEEDEDTPGASRGSAFGSLLKMPVSHSGGPEKAPLDLGEPIEGPPLDLSAFDETESEYGESELAKRELSPIQFPSVPSLLPSEFSEIERAESELSESQQAESEPTTIELPAIDPAEMELGDWLAAAREMAAAAHSSEDRTRNALYEAIGRAYDFSLAAAQTPEEFDELLADSGLTMQDRAPMTPVVKLVFGADYDKTRLTEYAAALAHAHRLELARGELGDYLGRAEGGLKGVVKAERRLRREEAGKAVEPIDAPRHAIAKKLRALPAQDFGAISAEGSEFALIMIRRTEAGEVVMLGEVPEDLALVERAARRLIG